MLLARNWANLHGPMKTLEDVIPRPGTEAGQWIWVLWPMWSQLYSCKDSQGCQGAADNRYKGPRGSETWSHWGDGWGPDEAGLNPGPKKWRLLRELTAEPGQVFKWGLPSTSTVPECSSIGMVSKSQAHGEHSVLHWWWCLLGMCEEEECQGRPGCGRSQRWWARGLIPNYPALKLSSFPVSQ